MSWHDGEFGTFAELRANRRDVSCGPGNFTLPSDWDELESIMEDLGAHPPDASHDEAPEEKPFDADDVVC